MKALLLLFLLPSVVHNTEWQDFVVEPKIYLQIPSNLSAEEQETTIERTIMYEGVRIQDKPARMHYPYIDGASRECRRLTEKQLQYKRSHPEISLTCPARPATRR